MTLPFSPLKKQGITKRRGRGVGDRTPAAGARPRRSVAAKLENIPKSQ
ncbi:MULTISPECIES: hypothetical protein [unclassified Microcoleus]